MLTPLFTIDVSDQYTWPPRDPDRDRPMRPLPNPLDNPFTYGTSFNPALTPSNANLRSRTHASQTQDSANGETQEPVDVNEQIKQEVYSSGDERDNSFSAGSSPEPYLSDMDDSDDEPDPRPEDEGRRVKVRRGSEGYEVAPIRSWNWSDESALDPV